MGRVWLARFKFMEMMKFVHPTPIAEFQKISCRKIRTRNMWTFVSALAFPFIYSFSNCAATANEASAENAAVELNVAYVGDVLSNTRGGIKQGVRYLDNLDIRAEVDLEKAIGLQGGRLFVYGLHNNGTTFSEDLVGDAQVVSNIEAIEAFRLYEAWYDQSLFRGRVSLMAGLIDLNGEFDVTELGGLFLNSSHGIGPDWSQSGEAGPSIFPVTSLGMRIAVSLTDRLLVKAAIFDATPGIPERPAVTAIKVGGEDGALLAAEAQYAFDNGVRIQGGFWRYTDSFRKIESNEFGRGAQGFYGSVQGPVFRKSSDMDKGLDAFVRFGRAAPRFFEIGHYVGAGLVYNGGIPGRPDDAFGVAVSMPLTSQTFRDAEDVDSSEFNIEVTYSAALTHWLRVQPDIQYVRNPGFDPEIDDALIVGIRFEFAQSAKL